MMKLFMKVFGKILAGFGILLGTAFFMGVLIAIAQILAMPFTSLAERDLELRVFTFFCGLLMVGVLLGCVYGILYEIQNPSRSSMSFAPLPPKPITPTPVEAEKKPILG